MSRFGVAERYFDIVIVTDLRFSGGTNAAVAAEIAAAARAGYAVGLIAYEADLNLPPRVNARLQSVVDAGDAERIAPGTPVRCRLALLHNPYVAGRLPYRGLRLTAEQRVVVVQHPPFDGFGRPHYDVAAAHAHAEEILGGPVRWAPIGPQVRRQFAESPSAPTLTPRDWFNTIDADAWMSSRTPRRSRAPAAPIAIGRHSRPDPRKWPATREAILEIYRDDPRVRIRALGVSPEIQALLAPTPSNWDLIGFDQEPVGAFLRSLDVYAFYHRDDWVEAFGVAILEAMAIGVPCVLPPHFEPLFEDAAHYAAPEEAFETALALGGDPERAAAVDARAQALIARKFSQAAAIARLKEMIGPPDAAGKRALAAPSVAERRRRHVLMISCNGVGMGHVARLLAIARRMPETIEPVFATMSMAIEPIRAFGYHVEHFPYHTYLDADVYLWNRYLALELIEMATAFDVRALVYDGNAPFQCVIDAARALPDCWSIWCRRGMWKPNHDKLFIERETHFDAVVEPDDLASRFDAGLTADRRRWARVVDPIRLLDRHERLTREAARAELGVSEDATVVLVQFGSGSNFDYAPMRERTIRTLLAEPNVEIVLADWLMAPAPVKTADFPTDRVVVLRSFPIARYLSAFDASVSAVGYNSFHEAIDAGVPTLFVPNENPRQDDQSARAWFAERNGVGLSLRANEISRLAPALRRLLDADERARMRAAATRFQRPNGAIEAARFIADLALTARGARPER